MYFVRALALPRDFFGCFPERAIAQDEVFTSSVKTDAYILYVHPQTQNCLIVGGCAAQTQRWKDLDQQ